MTSCAPTLYSSPSELVATGTLPPTAPAPDALTDFAELLKKLTAKEVTTLTALIGKRDANELTAYKKYARLEIERVRKKKKEQKKKRWRGCFVDESQLEADIGAVTDQELGVAVLPPCYEEIKRLLFIEKDPMFAKALEEWSRKELLFTSRVERKKSKVADLKNESYQLIGFFSVFQGVLLTAVSQSNLLHCNNWWSPIILSMVASVVTIFGVGQKLFQIRGFQNTIHSEEQSLKEVAAWLNTLRRKGVEGFQFAQFGHKQDKKQSTFRFMMYFILVMLSLIVFTVGFPISHWRILCDPGVNPYPS